MALHIKVTIKIVEDEFIEDDGIYKWTWVYVNGNLKFSIYHKL